MKVALVTVVHVLLIVAQLELAKANCNRNVTAISGVYMGRAQEDLSRLAGWRKKRSETEHGNMPEDGAKKQRVRGPRTLAEKVLTHPWGKEHGHEDTLRITDQTEGHPSAKPPRGPRHLLGKPGGHYVGNQPKWKRWKLKKKREKHGSGGKQNETGIGGNGNLLPDTKTEHNEGVTIGSGGPNNMRMTGGMGGYGGMMDPMSVGMMGSMGMGVGYGMTMGMGLGMASVMAPQIIKHATASIGNAATGIAKTIVAAKELSAINARKARRSRRSASEDMKDSKANSDSGANEGKMGDSKTEDAKAPLSVNGSTLTLKEKKKGGESESGDSAGPNKEEESRDQKPK